MNLQYGPHSRFAPIFTSLMGIPSQPVDFLTFKANSLSFTTYGSVKLKLKSHTECLSITSIMSYTHRLLSDFESGGA